MSDEQRYDEDPLYRAMAAAIDAYFASRNEGDLPTGFVVMSSLMETGGEGYGMDYTTSAGMSYYHAVGLVTVGLDEIRNPAEGDDDE